MKKDEGSKRGEEYKRRGRKRRVKKEQEKGEGEETRCGVVGER